MADNSTLLDPQSAKDLLKAYELIIEQYRDYAAYLKSYLCESLNALSLKLGPSGTRDSSLPSVMQNVAYEIARSHWHRSQTLRQENKELKGIIEGLIQNMGAVRGGRDPSVHAWSDIGTAK